MPQASDKQRAQMLRWFGDEVSDAGPLAFLEARGWTFPGGLCVPPVSWYTPNYYEFTCIEFLCDEWDYGYENPPWYKDVDYEI